jgi:hypothetical protein
VAPAASKRVKSRPAVHDEEANMLALNLMHDIVTGKKDVKAARG